MAGRNGRYGAYKVPAEAGNRYGQVEVIGEAPRRYTQGGKARRYVRVRCDCGVEKEMLLASLRGGTSMSCGCAQGQNRQRGDRHYNWKGGLSRTTNTAGYVLIVVHHEHPFAGGPYRSMLTPRGTNRNHFGVLEHRLVMAQTLGRPLESGETVHHKNGLRDDNRIDNLELRKGRHGAGQTWQCRSCGSHDIEATEL